MQRIISGVKRLFRKKNYHRVYEEMSSPELLSYNNSDLHSSIYIPARTPLAEDVSIIEHDDHYYPADASFSSQEW